MSKLILMLLFAAVVALAQPSNPDIVKVTTDPAGACVQGPWQYNTVNGNTWACKAGTWTLENTGGGGSGTVTSVTINGTAGQITATGTCTSTTVITCTLSLPSALVLPGTIDGLTITTTTGTLTIANAKVLTVNNTVTISGTDGSTLNIGAGGALGSAAFVSSTCSGDLSGTLPGCNVVSLHLPTPTTNAILKETSGGNATPSGCTIDSSNNLSCPGSGTFGTSGTGPALILPQGTAPSFPANSFVLFPPTSIATAFGWKTPAAAATGIVRGDNSSGTVSLSQAELSGDVTTNGSNAVTVSKINGTAFSGTSGHLTSFGASNTPADSGIVGSAVTQTIASGTAALGTSAISSGACATAVTSTATGTATTDVLTASFNGDPTAVTGYAPSTNGMLTIIAYPTANTANFKVCNNTSASITPGAITLNWRVVR